MELLSTKGLRLDPIPEDELFYRSKTNRVQVSNFEKIKELLEFIHRLAQVIDIDWQVFRYFKQIP